MLRFRTLKPSHRTLRSSLCFALLAGFALFVLSAMSTPGQIVFGAGIISGSAFIDYDANGLRGPTEPGVGGVLVKAYNSAGALSGSATTAANGTYSIDTTGSSAPYRVEFTIPDSLSYLYPSAHSTDSVNGGDSLNAGTTVQFVAAGNTGNVNLALMDPCEYCQANPRLVIPANAAEAPGGTDTLANDFALIGMNYDRTGQTNLLTAVQIGATWGVAYKNTTNQVFVSSFLKRHAGLGPREMDGVYVLNASTNTLSGGFDLQGVTASNGGAIDLGSVNRTVVSGSIPNTPAGDTQLSTAENTATVDLDAFAKIGKTGYGDIDMGEDGKTLWMVNLFQRTLVAVDTTQLGTLGNNPNTLVSAAVKHYNIVSGGPSPTTISGAPDCSVLDGQLRPFGLKFYRNKGYLGVVCDASSSGTNIQPSGLRGYVLSFDPANPTSFTTEVTLPLNHTREFAYQGGNNTNTVPGAWRRWTSSWSDFTTVTAVLNFTSGPQPIISDIEFSDSGAMLVGLTDRGSHMGGNNQYPAIAANPPNGRPDFVRMLSVGDLLRVPLNSSGTGWGTPEDGNTDTGSNPAPSDASAVTTFSSVDSVGNAGEFFWADYFPRGTNPAVHGETFQGGIAVRHGSGEVVTNAYDPRPNETWEQGLVYLSAETSAMAVNRYALFDSGTPTDADVRKRFGKGSGLGDMELLCNPAPIELGNRVWLDANKNGLQDPGENPIDGVTVQLWADTNGDNVADTQVGTAVTDANGEYYFGGLNNTNLGTTVVTRSITLGSDDAQQAGSTVTTTDTFLNLPVTAGDEDRLIGLRFQNITIPQGATITGATIMFTSNSNLSGPDANARIYGQAIDSAPTFAASANNISSRARTTTFVDWIGIAGWSTGESGPDTTTPGLAAIVQEIVNRSSWSSGNAIAFFLSDETGNDSTDHRQPRTFENMSGSPAQLSITYSYSVQWNTAYEVRVPLGVGNNTTKLGAMSLATQNAPQPANNNVSATTNDPFKDVADSDATATVISSTTNYVVSYTTGGPGVSNHGLDFGFTSTPTAENMGEASARVNGKGVVVTEWNTVNESKIVGFNVQRSAKKKEGYTNLNANLIGAKSPGQLTGNAYSARDKTVEAGKTYFYRIEVQYVDGSSELTKPIKVKVAQQVAEACSGAPQATTLLTPVNAETIKKAKTEFTWNAVPCATRYKWQLRLDSPEGKLVTAKKDLTEPSTTFKKLKAGKTYAWRVMSCNAEDQCTASEWSSVQIKAKKESKKQKPSP